MACDFGYFMSYWNPGQKLDSRLGMIHIQNTRGYGSGHILKANSEAAATFVISKITSS
ncbi:predicted protein [Botrytis cinerea T4]|uniref:Uncharacterized protein n=1 Tax=Botryotinia fuckeliana (strain T4) TaxID=999810 RepID=G2XSA2_BOTF4|nr:predicted protein [Botrytis cinerea T4]